MPHRTLILATLCIGSLACLTAAADETAVRIGRLVVRLGSASFTEREEATKDLDAIGAAALPALKKAATSDDVETRRRAEELVARIEKRLETSRLLAPTKVSLQFRETPVKDAIAEFGKITGHPIALTGDESKIADRKVTLVLKDVPFWQALDQFCEATGLIEPGAVSMPLNLGSWWGRGRRIPRQLPAMPPPGPSAISTQIVLADGKHLSLPTYHAGAARIRAFPPNAPLPATRTEQGELLFSLGLGLEERMPLQKVLSLRIDRAIDEHGQSLQQLFAAAAPADDPSGPVFLGNFNGQPQAIISAAGQHPVQVRLKEGEKRAKRLKEFTGTIGVEIRTPPEPVVTVDNILKAAGSHVKGIGPASLKVHEVSRDDEGAIAIKFTLETQPDPARNTVLNGWPNQVALGAQAIRVGGFSIGPTGDLDLSLVDAKGGSYEVVGDPTRILTIEAAKVTHETTLKFKAQPGQGPPAMLIYRAARLTTLEIPFTLKDVPLP